MLLELVADAALDAGRELRVSNGERRRKTIPSCSRSRRHII